MSDTAEYEGEEVEQPEKLPPYDERTEPGLPGSAPQAIPSWPGDDYEARRKALEDRSDRAEGEQGEADYDK